MTDLGVPGFALHPLHGPHEPTTSTPTRRPGSVRRTSSMDITRTPGSPDPVYLLGRARDLITGRDGSAGVARTAELTATVELLRQVVRAIATDPPVPELAELVGRPPMAGFRPAADAAIPKLRHDRDLLYTLIDDVPGSTLISGHALGASGQLESARTGFRPLADQCAGFVTGGVMSTMFASEEAVIVTGPPAPDLRDPDDPLAWHEFGDLPLHAMRRARRIDVADGGDGAEVHIDAMFRDTYVRGDGVETIIHEYTLQATVDLSGRRVLESRATPRVLPWQECPAAAQSAARITGMTLPELHSRVRRELHGTSTCTHLNDLLRSVADAEALITLLPPG